MKRIDDSHQPFKRTKKLGPGPRRRPPIHESKTFVCRRAKPTAKHYVQLCTYVGADGAKYQTTIRTKKGWKKRYNKQYRAWAARKRTALVARGPQRGYRCRRTASTRCR
jgi:hypothetical protein